MLQRSRPTARGRPARGAVFDLASYALRPDGYTSADAAGLPILPGLVRYDEIAAGEIAHAIRFTAPQTRRDYVWPARHYASSLTDARYPPMGERFRLRADFDLSSFSPEVRVVLRALKKYGMILADNGSSWYLSGAPDPRWNNDRLAELGRVPGSAFEAVDVSSLMADPDSGRVRPGVMAVPDGTGLPTDTNADGLYDDVNGNGRCDFADVVLYFNEMSWIAANEPRPRSISTRTAGSTSPMSSGSSTTSDLFSIAENRGERIHCNRIGAIRSTA